jgi:predicted DNA-binding ribbon-helix-helix protein
VHRHRLGHKTNVTVEDAFWTAFKEIAATKGVPVADLVSILKSNRHGNNLSSAIRLFVLEHYRC